MEVPEKRPRKPKEKENKPGKYDPRNKLNDLTGKEWLLLTKSWWMSEPSKYDKTAYDHPAPFLVKDVEKLIKMFTKKGMTVLDPFVGSGTTMISSSILDRKSIGIDLNPGYKDLAEKRFEEIDMVINDYEYRVGNAKNVIKDIEEIDYIVTSPPYHNILRNNSKGIRHYNGKNYRIAARDGVEYYTESDKDLGNFEKYENFLGELKKIMKECYVKLKKEKYCTVIMSDFTVNKNEVCVQGDVVRMMENIGFKFCGTTVLLQDVKPLYPFGYPYAYKINHHHHNMMHFRKME